MDGAEQQSPSLVFVGGVSGTKKTAIIKQVCATSNGYFIHLQISEFYKMAMGETEDERDTIEAEEWKELEDDAIRHLCERVHEHLADSPTAAYVINTHFMTRSPRGFMPGTDPKGIKMICETLRLRTAGSTGRAGVVLMDSAPAALIANQSKAEQIRRTLNSERDLQEDLDENRSKSMVHYHTLVGLLDADRVDYVSLLVNEDPILLSTNKRGGPFGAESTASSLRR